MCLFFCLFVCSVVCSVGNYDFIQDEKIENDILSCRVNLPSPTPQLNKIHMHTLCGNNPATR